MTETNTSFYLNYPTDPARAGGLGPSEQVDLLFSLVEQLEAEVSSLVARIAALEAGGGSYTPYGLKFDFADVRNAIIIPVLGI